MVALSLVATLRPDSVAQAGEIADMTLSVENGVVRLYTLSGGLTTGLARFRLDSGGTPQLTGSLSLPGGPGLDAPSGLELVQTAGGMMLMTLGRGPQAVLGVDLNGGAFGAADPLAGGLSAGTGLDACVTVGTGGGARIYAALAGSEGIAELELTGGALTLAGSSPDRTSTYAADVAALATARIGGQDYLFSACAAEDGVSAFRVGAGGALAHTDSLGAAQSLGIAVPTALEAVTLLGGGGGDVLTGGSGADRLYGDAGDDWLAGGDGANRIDGGVGTDTLDFSDATGRAFADLGIDQRGAGFLRFYDVGQPQGDTYAGIENIVGGAYADNLRGDGGSNALLGGGVSDRLYGRDGNDWLDGGPGADALYGNRGADIMTGGPDAGRRDRYIYFGLEESGVGAGYRDRITDFTPGEDRIEISRFDADATRPGKQRFDFIGEAAFSGTPGELAYRHEGGATVVQADVDGDRMPDFEIELAGLLTLGETDFLL